MDTAFESPGLAAKALLEAVHKAQKYYHDHRDNPPPDSVSFSPFCPICNANEVKQPSKLLRCGGCKVTYFCTTAHQGQYLEQHQKPCRGVQKARNAFDELDKKMRETELALSEGLKAYLTANNAARDEWFQQRLLWADSLTRIGTPLALKERLEGYMIAFGTTGTYTGVSLSAAIGAALRLGFDNVASHICNVSESLLWPVSETSPCVDYVD